MKLSSSETTPLLSPSSPLEDVTHDGESNNKTKKTTFVVVKVMVVAVVLLLAVAASSFFLLQINDDASSLLQQQQQQVSSSSSSTSGMTAAALLHSMHPNKDPVAHLLYQLDAQLDGRVLWQHHHDEHFETASEIWNQNCRAPRAVVECRSERDVQQAVPILAYIDQHYGVPFRIKSGGHSYTGWSGIENGIILSVRQLNHVTLNTKTGVATLGPGATVQDVLAAALPKGFGGVVGFCPGVGEGGFSLSGGVGVQSRLHGLGIDNVLSARMVDYRGKVLVASPNHDQDLYFALRGAGNGNFGVVTQLQVQMYPIAKQHRGQEILSLEATIPLEDWPEFSLKLGTMDVPRGFFPFFEGGIVPDLADPDVESIPTAFLYTGDDLNAGKQYLQDMIVPMLPLNSDDQPEYAMEVLSWYNWTVESGNFEGNYVQAWTGFLHAENNTIAVWKEIKDVLVNLLRRSPYLSIDVEVFGGAIATSALPDETAFPFRSALWNVGISLGVPTVEEDAQQVYNDNVAMVNDAWPSVAKYLQGVYLNYPMESLSKDEYPMQYWGSNLERLMDLKLKYDPFDVFYHPQSVPLP